MLNLDELIHLLKFLKGVTKMNMINTCHTFRNLNVNYSDLLPPCFELLKRGTLKHFNTLTKLTITITGNNPNLFKILKLPPSVNNLHLFIKDNNYRFIKLPFTIKSVTMNIRIPFHTVIYVNRHKPLNECMYIQSKGVKSIKIITNQDLFLHVDIPYDLQRIKWDKVISLYKDFVFGRPIIRGYSLLNYCADELIDHLFCEEGGYQYIDMVHKEI